jgi:anaphase-promoting complex subunit 11
MKVTVKHWHAVAQWRWDTGAEPSSADTNDGENDDVCGICRVPYEGCCPSCKMPGDDCPLSASYSLRLLRSVLNIKWLLYYCSLGRMHACLPHALSPQVDRHPRVEAAMSHGSARLGCVLSSSLSLTYPSLARTTPMLIRNPAPAVTAERKVDTAP